MFILWFKDLMDIHNTTNAWWFDLGAPFECLSRMNDETYMILLKANNCTCAELARWESGGDAHPRRGANYLWE